MKKRRDPKQVNFWLEKSGIASCFSTPHLEFSLYEYEKGEQISSPSQRLEMILFLMQGTIRVYGLRSNGTVVPVNQQQPPALLGDMEFVEKGELPFFIEAVTDVTCVGLPFQPYKEQLNQDVRFLQRMLQSYAEKIQYFAWLNAFAETIEERVLFYLEKLCPDHQLHGIEGAVLQIRCSRRQLQRVLQKLCQEGRVEKLGKGQYRLLSPEKGKGRSL